jgi:sugar phosphate isomerase/epimerase
MQIGIFETVFPRKSLSETLDVVLAHGVRHLQFDLTSAGITRDASDISLEACRNVQELIRARGMTISAVGGFFNMCHPDPRHREAGLEMLRAIASHCSLLGTNVIALCSGTRNTQSMWHFHPDNSTAEAWKDLLPTMKKAAAIGEEFRVIMAFEPEVSNVIDSPKRARKMLDEVGSSALKVVMDGANIFHKGELPKMREILSEAFELLGKDIVLAHAKDLDHDGEAGHRAAGEGLLDYEFYLAGLERANFKGALVLHGLTEAQAPQCLKFVKSKLPRH